MISLRIWSGLRASPIFFMVVLGTPFWMTRAMSGSVPPWIQRLSVRSGPLPPRPAPPWQPLHKPAKQSLAFRQATDPGFGHAGLRG